MRQADGAVSTAGGCGAPGKIDENAGRRSFLRSLALVPMVAAGAALPASAAGASRADWDRALVRHARALRAYGRAQDAQEAAERGCYAERPRHPNGLRVERGDTIEAATARYDAIMAEIARCDAKWRLKEHEEATERAGDEEALRFRELLACPAPDHAALLFKIEHMGAEHWTDNRRHVARDVRRMGGLA